MERKKKAESETGRNKEGKLSVNKLQFEAASN